jgi:hypothetical protein
MWMISISPSEFADEKLASLSIESPTNLRNADEFGLLVALWCGRVRDVIDNEDGRYEFSFGFRVGEIVVESAGGRIGIEGRLKVEGGRIKIAQSEIDQAKKEGLGGLQLAISLSKWLGGIGKADINVGGQANRTLSTTEQKDSEYSQTFWRVADAGHNFWRIFGHGLNADSVLEHKIIGDEPICHIAVEQSSDSVELVVSFRCDLRDVWFQREGELSGITDGRFDKKQNERNRAAVAKRICSIALHRDRLGSNAANDRMVILARQALRAAREAQSDGGRHDKPS